MGGRRGLLGAAAPGRSVWLAVLVLAVALASGRAGHAVLAARSPAPPALLLGVSASEFAGRRAAVRQAAAGALVLLVSPAENEDIDRERYRADDDLVYLTGVDAPRACLALLPKLDDAASQDTLFLPARLGFGARWTDPVLGPDDEARAQTGLASVRPASEQWEALRPYVERARVVYLSGPVGERARYTPTGAVEARLHSINQQVEVRDAGELVDPLRWRKSAGEIANLRAAIAATAAGERSAARAIRPGAAELAVEGAILAAFRAAGATREGFPCIVGSGPNSVVLHHFSGARRMEAGELVVVDIGAEVNYYTGDLTRTFPCGGRFTPRQRQVYQLVLDTQRACERAVVPGQTTLADLQRCARDILRRSPLRARGRGGVERTMDAYFIHFIGHSLGMDVHDVERGDSVLRPGVVFTIEPGVYLADEGIGVRIEDDYLVTATGVEKLSAALPSDLAGVERMVADAGQAQVPGLSRPVRRPLTASAGWPRRGRNAPRTP